MTCQEQTKSRLNATIRHKTYTDFFFFFWQLLRGTKSGTGQVHYSQSGSLAHTECPSLSRLVPALDYSYKLISLHLSK